MVTLFRHSRFSITKQVLVFCEMAIKMLFCGCYELNSIQAQKKFSQNQRTKT